MLFYESFDAPVKSNSDKENKKIIEQKEKQIIQEFKVKAEQEAFDKALKETQKIAEKNKSEEISDFMKDINQKIGAIKKEYEETIKEQSAQQTDLMLNILHYFMPNFIQEKITQQLRIMMIELLDNCKQRKIEIKANSKNIAYFDGYQEDNQVILTCCDTISDETVDILFEGGGAHIEMKEIEDKMIAEIKNIFT